MHLPLAKVDDTDIRSAAASERLLTAAERQIYAAVQSAADRMRESVNSERLRLLIEDGRTDEALDVVVSDGAGILANGAEGATLMSARQTGQLIDAAIERLFFFDVTNDRAVKLMREERLRLIREFTAAQREATRNALVAGIQAGENPAGQARRFRNSIGLTLSQNVAVERYRDVLTNAHTGTVEALNRELRDRRFDGTVARAARTGEPLTDEQIDRMVERYRERFIRFRSETIARTEALRATNNGGHLAFMQAVDEGLLEEGQIEREWVTARDERVRSSHAKLHGLKRGINETFPSEGGPLLYPGDPAAPADETIRCRCVLAHRMVSL